MKDRHHNNKIFRDGMARGREMQREATAHIYAFALNPVPPRNND